MSELSPPFASSEVAATFKTFPSGATAHLLALRSLIFSTAQATPGVGRIEETLKWGQPAYLTPDTKSGTTIRLGTPKSGGTALYVHCQTTLISEFRSLFPAEFNYDGNRAILFDKDVTSLEEPLRLFIGNALTYHLK
ncbi:DUF1801 domain-containing protein [Aliiroseovarius sp. 2305UL8-7]|uniref:DUF1801 domain-containing protein n=1 Tax=Aliiroseovarius conchicola TaxID=3121637 RepID=UPI0035295140